MPGRPMKPIARPVATPARPQFFQRPAPIASRPINPVRVVAREIKREAVNVSAQQLLNRPRPVVRPAAPPVKLMPKQPTPAPIIRPAAPAFRPAAPVVRPAAPVVRPAAPVARPAVPAVRPAAPIARPVVPAVRPSAPAVRPPIIRPGKPAAGAPRQTAPAAPVRPGVPRFQPAAPVQVPVGRPMVVDSTGVAQEMMMMVSALNAGLSELQSRSSFTQVQSDLTNLDANLQHTLDLLEGARNQGYVYQRDLEDIAYQAVDQWQSVRTQVQNSIQEQALAFQGRMAQVGGTVNQVNAQLRGPMGMSLVGNAQSQVNGLLNEVNQVQSSLENSYSSVESAVSTLNYRLTPIHWALKQLKSASFNLQDKEDLVMAVPARWDLEGDEDPEGILYLSNKRLIFEQKEEVATKKVLFITVAKELVQKVLVDQPLPNLKNVKAVNKGLFGNQDFIEVEFAEPRFKNISFHLNGQDCKQWVVWIESAKSGEIENDRYSGGTLSVADLTGPLTTGDLMALQNEVNGLQDEMMLKGARDELAAIENDVRSLERKLAELRAKGYVIEKSLEADIAVLATQWDRVKANAEKTIETESQLLSGQMKGIQDQLGRLMGMSANLAAARPQFMQLKSEIASVDAQADAALSTVLAQYDDYADEVETLTAHLEWVGWMLDAIATASFQLLATESGVAAVEAMYARPGMEAENGVLFLTDQRLLWEDRVGTYELKIEAALQQVQDVQKVVDEATGAQMLAFTFAAGLPYPSAQVNLSMPVADDWLKMIGRARSGGYAQDRAEAIDPAELERIRNAPQQCSNCGAALSAPILRGQTEIKCEYCGVATRF